MSSSSDTDGLQPPPNGSLGAQGDPRWESADQHPLPKAKKSLASTQGSSLAGAATAPISRVVAMTQVFISTINLPFET